MTVTIWVVFFCAFWLYVFFHVDPAILCNQQWPVFLLDNDFFASFLDTPGGLSEYAAAFGSQFHYVPWAGGLAITVLAIGISLAMQWAFTAIAGKRLRPWLPLVPAVWMLVLLGRYHYVPAAGVAMFISLAMAGAYARLGLSGQFYRLGVFMALSVPVYWVCGGYYVLFAGLCGIFELFARGRFATGAVCLLCAIGLPALYALYSYDTGYPQAYLFWLPYHDGLFRAALIPHILRSSLHLLLPVCVLLSACWLSSDMLHGGGGRVAKLFSRRRKSPSESTGVSTGVPSPTRSWTAGGLMTFMISSTVLVFLTFNSGAKARLNIDLLARQRQWDLLLIEARQLPLEYYDIFVSGDVQKALHYTGRLPYDLFHYPEGWGLSRLWAPYISPLTFALVKRAETFADMGHVNRAEHLATDILSIEGPRPQVLQSLARIHILKDNPAGAEVYLRLLAKSPMHRKWAIAYLEELQNDPKMQSDEVVSAVRPMVNRQDLLYGDYGTISYDEQMSQLLRSNIQNRMAFEYLMAHYLRRMKTRELVKWMEHLPNYDYPGIPPLYAQAMLFHQANDPEDSPNLSGQRISKKAKQLAATYEKDLATYMTPRGINRYAAREGLAGKYAGTFFYYRSFGPLALGNALGSGRSVTGASK